jgi:hypothetical protein
MIWWFVVLGFSSLLVVGVAIAIFLRIRTHWRIAGAAAKEGRDPLEHETLDHR